MAVLFIEVLYCSLSASETIDNSGNKNNTLHNNDVSNNITSRCFVWLTSIVHELRSDGKYVTIIIVFICERLFYMGHPFARFVSPPHHHTIPPPSNP